MEDEEPEVLLGMSALLDKLIFKVLADAAGKPEQAVQLVQKLAEYLSFAIVGCAPAQPEVMAKLMEGILNFIPELVTDYHASGMGTMLASVIAAQEAQKGKEDDEMFTIRFPKPRSD